MRRRSLAFVALSLALAACGGGDATAPADPRQAAAGTNHLRTVNGASLPAALGTVNGVRVEVLSDAYTLNTDGTYSERGQARLTQASTGTVVTQDVSETGTWTINGTAIVTTATDRTQTTLAYSNGSLTSNNEGLVFTYRR
jgi:hypothetical protein